MNDHALVVGVARYPGLAVRGVSADLEGPDNDAGAIRDWLVDPDGGGLDQANVTVIRSGDFAATPEEPAAARIERELSRLEERTRDGAKWTRRQWAETTLAEQFRQRLPAEANQAVSNAYAGAERYIAGYNIWMHHLVDAKGQRLFPAGKRLLSHWNLRDELKANYSEGKAGLAKQRSIQRVMERIVAQQIPAVVIDNPGVDWDPFTNAVTRSTVNDVPAGMTPRATPAGAIDNAREPDTRYATWLADFRAEQVVDRYSPGQPTYIQRVFENGRQLSEQRVQDMLEKLLGSPQVKEVAQLIQKRLGRRLEPFDIWYSGFRAGSGQDESQLDALVAKRYPDAAAFQRDIPDILRRLGFAPDRADHVARTVPPEVVLPDHDETIGIAIRQRAQQNTADHTEDRRGRADSQRERKHGRHGEARRAQK